MGRDRVRWIYHINLEKQRYRIVRVFNTLGVNFHIIILEENEEKVLEEAKVQEPGYEYEILPIDVRRLYVPNHYCTK